MRKWPCKHPTTQRPCEPPFVRSIPQTRRRGITRTRRSTPPNTTRVDRMTYSSRTSGTVAAAVMLALAAARSGPSIAQPADAASTSPLATAPAQVLEEVTVTGSRIRRSVPDTAQPIDVLGGQNILDRGLANVADAVNELPGVGVP